MADSHRRQGQSPQAGEKAQPSIRPETGSGRPNGLTTRDPRHEARSQRAKSRALAPRGGTDSIEDLQPYLILGRLIRYGATTSKEGLLSTQDRGGERQDHTRSCTLGTLPRVNLADHLDYIWNGESRRGRQTPPRQTVNPPASVHRGKPEAPSQRAYLRGTRADPTQTARTLGSKARSRRGSRLIPQDKQAVRAHTMKHRYAPSKGWPQPTARSSLESEHRVWRFAREVSETTRNDAESSHGRLAPP